MESRLRITNELFLAQLQLEAIEAMDTMDIDEAVKLSDKVLDIFRKLMERPDIESAFKNTINYCIIKMEHAKQLTERFATEEGVELARQTVAYCIREADLEWVDLSE